MKKLTRTDVTIQLERLEEDAPLRGNISAVDPKTDAEAEAEVRKQLAAGNEWAWFCAHVVVTWHGLRAEQYLGCCSYHSEEDFKAPGGYYDDMIDGCLAEIQEQAEKIGRAIITDIGDLLES